MSQKLVEMYPSLGIEGVVIKALTKTQDGRVRLTDGSEYAFNVTNLVQPLITTKYGYVWQNNKIDKVLTRGQNVTACVQEGTLTHLSRWGESYLRMRLTRYRLMARRGPRIISKLDFTSKQKFYKRYETYVPPNVVKHEVKHAVHESPNSALYWEKYDPYAQEWKYVVFDELWREQDPEGNWHVKSFSLRA